MATGMKFWTGLVVTGLLLMMAWKLPPSAIDIAQPEARLHEETRYLALVNDLQDAQSTLMRVRWADSLTALIAERAEESDGPFVITPEGVETGGAAEMEAYMAKWLGSGDGAPQALLVSAYQDRNHGLIRGARTDNRWRNETYVGEIDGRPYCMRISVSHAPHQDFAWDLDFLRKNEDSEAVRWDRFDPFAICRVWLEHGPPSATVQAWLERGGTQFGTEHERVVLNDRYYVANRSRVGLFGDQRSWNSSLLLEDDRCRAGVADACARIFSDPSVADPSIAADQEIASRSPALAIRDRNSVLVGEASLLMHDLKAEFGQDAFEAFWTSQESDIEGAFEAAFGVDVGAWMVEWLDERVGIDKPGPVVAQTDKFGGILFMTLFATYAAIRNRRRTVA